MQRTYTIFAEHQYADIAPIGLNPVVNSAGQTVLFDGKASKTEIDKMVATALLYYRKVQVFRGARVGKLVWENKDWQTVCTQ